MRNRATDPVAPARYSTTWLSLVALAPTSAAADLLSRNAFVQQPQVIAVDLSSGPELGHAFRRRYEGAHPDRVHFVQADLQTPVLGQSSVDIVHSSGVLHHTPNTERTFRGLCPLVRPGGIFYVWLYKPERFVTRLVNALRSLSTRIPPPMFARVAKLLADPFRLFCWTLNALDVRRYPPLSRREAALALMDIFGAPFAHAHTFEEVASWMQGEGFDEVWPCNETRRGFGACGKRPDGDSLSTGGHAEARVTEPA